MTAQTETPATIDPTAPGAVRFTFQPLVSLVLREDGRYDAEVDWSDSQTDTYTNDAWAYDVGAEDGVTEAAQVASYALDAWIKGTVPTTNPGVTTFIVPALPTDPTA